MLLPVGASVSAFLCPASHLKYECSATSFSQVLNAHAQQLLGGTHSSTSLYSSSGIDTIVSNM